MKNQIKRIFTLLLTTMCMISLNMNVFATEENKVIGDCRLTFSLTDNTNGAFTDEITITLLNMDTNLQYNYKMKSTDYLLGITVGGNVKQGNYKIALSYPNKDQYTIQNVDGTEISAFDASSTKHIFDWIVVVNDTGEKKLGTGRAEADEVWKTFLDCFSAIEHDSKIFKTYENTAEFCSKYYETITGNSRQEYMDMSAFDKFLWYDTYIFPSHIIKTGEYQIYLSSVIQWNSNVAGRGYGNLKIEKATEQAEAFKTLMEWQYNYFIEHGTIYNFLEPSPIEEVIITETSTSVVVTEPTAETTKIEIPTTTTVKTEPEVPPAAPKKGIWDSTIELIKDNKYTIAILLILVGITIGVIIYRKNRAIDDQS